MLRKNQHDGHRLKRRLPSRLRANRFNNGTEIVVAVLPPRPLVLRVCRTGHREGLPDLLPRHRRRRVASSRGARDTWRHEVGTRIASSRASSRKGHPYNGGGRRGTRADGPSPDAGVGGCYCDAQGCFPCLPGLAEHVQSMHIRMHMPHMFEWSCREERVAGGVGGGGEQFIYPDTSFPGKAPAKGSSPRTETDHGRRRDYSQSGARDILKPGARENSRQNIVFGSRALPARRDLDPCPRALETRPPSRRTW